MIQMDDHQNKQNNDKYNVGVRVDQYGSQKMQRKSFRKPKIDVNAVYWDNDIEDNSDTSANIDKIKRIIQPKQKENLLRMINSAKILSKSRIKCKARIQILNENRVHKLFQFWKQKTKLSFKKRIEAELFYQDKIYKQFKLSFNQWKNAYESSKKASKFHEKVLYRSFFMICSSQLAIRFKRLHLQKYLKKKYFNQIILNLKQNYEESQEINSKVQQYDHQTLLKKCFQILKRQKNTEYNLINKKLSLAQLHYKRLILTKCFNKLKQN